MTPGPLRRVVSVLGLLALVPIALELARGTLAPEDAALRALAVGAAVVVVGRLARAVLTATLRRVEAEAEEGGAEPATAAGDVGGRVGV